MHNKIIFITGGARSGKSAYALSNATRISGDKTYIATAEALDKEMRERIEKHKRQRGKEWDTFEEPLKIAKVIKEIEGKYTAIVLDCLTLWLSKNNFYFLPASRFCFLALSCLSRRKYRQYGRSHSYCNKV